MHINVQVRFGGGPMEKYQGYEPEGMITLEVSKAVALVLDNLLDRWTGSDDDNASELRTMPNGMRSRSWR